MLAPRQKVAETAEAAAQFLRDFVDLFARCSTTAIWRPLEELLEDWQATAVAQHNPELLETWRSRGRSEDYVLLEAPDAT